MCCLSYQVLARKWRPKIYSEVVGQKHVLQALINALNNNRLHHAYLFSGTRGVGKTTLGRIFAKSLNCDEGVGAEPCGICTSCREIDEGRFVDLLEVDAASRTKVDETRELLENVQYAPTKGRFKVYLIDEVHMLTNHSFNALLKTLEEPPPHVKFILATTDPQKLPVTILSRCLKLNLSAISHEMISDHMAFVLEQEKVPAEDSALRLIAKSALGSMRDALSLLDQAIAHGNGEVKDTAVREMLGTINNKDVVGIVRALIDEDPAALLHQVGQLVSQGVIFSAVLSELVSTLHLLALAQLVPDALDDEHAHLLELSSQISADEIQLYYQIALMGQKDLPLAPDPRAGFEMVLLRMFAFRPDEEAAVQQSPPAIAPRQSSVPVRTLSPVSNGLSSAESAATSSATAATATTATTATTGSAAAKRAINNSGAGSSAVVKSSKEAIGKDLGRRAVAGIQAEGSVQASAPQNESTQVSRVGVVDITDESASGVKPANQAWESTVNQLPLTGMARQLISNSQFLGKKNGTLSIKLDQVNANLAGEAILERVQQALSQFYNESLKLKIVEGVLQESTPAEQQAKRQSDALDDAVKSMQSDPNIVAMEKTFGTQLDPKSVKLIKNDENRGE